MSVGNDHHARRDGTESHDYYETVGVKHRKSSKDLDCIRLFGGFVESMCVFWVFCRVGVGSVMNRWGDVKLLRR
jgi:hypothetical protein